MCAIVEEYGKKQRDAGVKSGKTLGRKELMTVVLLLKKGSSKEQIKDMGYEDSTIEDAYLLL